MMRLVLLAFVACLPNVTHDRHSLCSCKLDDDYSVSGSHEPTCSERWLEKHEKGTRPTANGKWRWPLVLSRRVARAALPTYIDVARMGSEIPEGLLGRLQLTEYSLHAHLNEHCTIPAHSHTT